MQKPTNRLSVEQLECREVPATGLFLDTQTGILSIEGSTANDYVRVDHDQIISSTGSFEDRQHIHVTLQTDFGYQIDNRFRIDNVSMIQFQGKRGTDLFVNTTSILSTSSSWTGGLINSSLILGSPGNATPEQTGRVGVFTVGTTGTVAVDYLYKGAGYRGQLGFYSLTGMNNYTPGSADYIKEAARRALSNSTDGYVVINAQLDGARFSANLPWEGNLNSGTYRGVTAFSMIPDSSFAAILVPNGAVKDVFNNPTVGGDKHPLFSVPEANPYSITPQMRGQVGDLDGHGNIFAFEDLRLDGSSDRDYNDMVFQVTGARGIATPVNEVINQLRNFLSTIIGEQILEYANRNAVNDVSTVAGSGNAGVFRVGSSGQIGIDYLFDGGGYAGELALFSLQGMANMTPGSTEFIHEASQRSLSNSVLGHVAISDLQEGARISAALPWETNFNKGNYLGAKSFTMTAGDSVGFMLVPNGTVWELFNNSALTGSKRPLFSLASANPTGSIRNCQLASLNTTGTVLGFEDQRQDGGCDRDYNDMIFKLIGMEGNASTFTSVVNSAKSIMQQSLGDDLFT